MWVGSSSTLRSLESAAPVLEEVGRCVPGVQLKLICDRFFRLRHLPVIECPWSTAGEAEAIVAGDIGVSWIPDDLWSRGKCGLKVLQYMAAGLPVIANPVGVHPEMIRPGQNGYLATTAAEWVEAITRLASDGPLRRGMGRLGAIASKRITASKRGRRWLAVLDRLHQRSARIG